MLRTRHSDVILTWWATVVGEVTSASGDTMCHFCAPVVYVVHFFLGDIHSRGLKFLQVVHENFDCDLTHGFFIQDFNKFFFVMTKNVMSS